MLKENGVVIARYRCNDGNDSRMPETVLNSSHLCSHFSLYAATLSTKSWLPRFFLGTPSLHVDLTNFRLPLDRTLMQLSLRFL